MNEDEIVDVDAIEFADDIEEIVISDYSGEEEDLDVEIVENTSQSVPGSELKISSVVSCLGLEFGDNIEESRMGNIGEINSGTPETQSDLQISAVLGEVEDSDSSSSDGNFSYDSATEEEGNGEKESVKRAAIERNRRNVLRSLYQNLWKAISSDPLKPTCSKTELLQTSFDMMKKLTIEGRTLEYSTEICLQSNYRLKRRLKKVGKRKRKQSLDSRENPKPRKVVSSRASI